VIRGIALLALFTAGCAHTYTRTDLDITLSKHHIDLRWGRIENAAQRVDPDLRAAFLAEWTKRGNEIELQDLDVAGVAMAEDGNSADVVVNFTYVERDTMSVRQVQVIEKWERTADGWLAKKPATLDPKGLQPTPVDGGPAPG
jgi:hypothetical protein